MTANDLRDHRVTEHLWKVETQPPFTCSHSSCGQRFGSKAEQKDHLSRVHGVRVTAMTKWAANCKFKNCDFCSNHTSDLKAHVTDDHIAQLQAAAQKNGNNDPPIVLLDDSDAEATADELTNEFDNLSSGEDPRREKKTSQPSAQGKAAIAGPSTAPRKKSVSGRQPVSRDSSPDVRPGERLRKHPAGSPTNVRKELSGQQKFYTETSESDRPGASGSPKGKQAKARQQPKASGDTAESNSKKKQVLQSRPVRR
jgi:hypothetical protein